MRYAAEGGWVIGAGRLSADVKERPLVKQTAQIGASPYAGWHF